LDRQCGGQYTAKLIKRGIGVETMKKAGSVSRILYRIEDDARYEWLATAEPLALPLAWDTALQMKRNGIQILVCPEEEFDEKGLPETYEAEEYFTEEVGRPTET